MANHRGGRGCQTAHKPGSVPPGEWLRAAMAIPLGRPLPDASCDRPERRREGSPGIPGLLPRCLPLLLGLAPGGVFPAAAVAGGAVRSYRTVSPLPPVRRAEPVWRCPFCGTVPGVAPAGRYPAPYLRGARTFLSPRQGGERPSGRLASKIWVLMRDLSKPRPLPGRADPDRRGEFPPDVPGEGRVDRSQPGGGVPGGLRAMLRPGRRSGCRIVRDWMIA
jgi:hypothetical protein